MLPHTCQPQHAPSCAAEQTLTAQCRTCRPAHCIAFPALAPAPPADYALSRFNESLSLVLLDASDYDAIYIADGHGLMWDGPYNSEIKRLVEEAWVGTSLTTHHPGSCIVEVAGRTCMTAL